MNVIVTRHAIQRYQERVANVSDSDARLAILASERVIALADSIGASVVILGCGARLVVDGGRVITVVAKGMKVRDTFPERLS